MISRSWNWSLRRRAGLTIEALMRAVRLLASGLLGMLLLALVGLMALRVSSKPFFQYLYGITVAVLLTAAVLARLRRGDAGTYWVGFATAGWGLLAGGIWTSARLACRRRANLQYPSERNGRRLS